MEKSLGHPEMYGILKIGLIGFGAMGRTHLFAVNSLPYYFDNKNVRAEVYGICTAHFDVATEIAREFGIPKVYRTSDELISDPEIDIVDICTPNYMHYDAIIKAAENGKHILCEKPLCDDIGRSREVLLCAKRLTEHGKVCGMVFNNRFLSPVIRAKQLVDEGRLGRILSFKGEYLHDSCLDTSKKAGWKQSAQYGGGVLSDLGPHVIDIIRYLCGDFRSVCGMEQIAFPRRTGINGEAWETDADEAFYMTATLNNGAYGSITVSKLATGSNDDLSFEISGTDGALKFSLNEPDWLYFYDVSKPAGDFGGERGFTRIECIQRYGKDCIFPSRKASQGWLRGHIGSMYSYLKCVSEGRSFSPSFVDGAYVDRVINAARRAAHENITVNVDE